jgi:YD repeat-containing protein
MSDAVGASAFAYQNFGAFQSALAAENGPWAADTVTHSYSNRLPAYLTLAQPGGSWTESYGFDNLLRLHTLASGAGTFTYTYNGAGQQIQSLSLPGASSIANTYNAAGQITETALSHSSTNLDSQSYVYDVNGNRTSVTRADNSYVNYGYDYAGQLTGAAGFESSGTPRGNENFGYQYDPAANLAMRTNNTLIQTFTTDGANELGNITRNNLLTVAGVLTNHPTSLAMNGQTATIYNDLTFAATNGVTINDGLNTLTAVVVNAGITLTNSLVKTLPASVNLDCDLNGNLSYDGLKAYQYDRANELTGVTVTNQWQVQYVYDGFGRRRIRRQYVWNNAWIQTSETHYVYDGMQVIQERDGANNPKVSYTRGVDFSGTMSGAGGIGGLLARTDTNGSAFYHADGNGNITLLVDASGNQLAKYLYDSFGNPLGMGARWRRPTPTGIRARRLTRNREFTTTAIVIMSRICKDGQIAIRFRNLAG